MACLEQVTDAMVAGGLSTLETLLASDVTLTHLTGLVQSRHEWLAAIGADDMKYHQIDFVDMRVDEAGARPQLTVRTLTDATIWGKEHLAASAPGAVRPVRHDVGRHQYGRLDVVNASTVLAPGSGAARTGEVPPRLRATAPTQPAVVDQLLVTRADDGRAFARSAEPELSDDLLQVPR